MSFGAQVAPPVLRGHKLWSDDRCCASCRFHSRVDLNKEDWRSVDAWIQGVLGSLGNLGLKTAAQLGGTLAATHAEGGGCW